MMTKKMGSFENIPAACGLTRRQLLAASAGAILASGVSAAADSVTAIMAGENNGGVSAHARPKPDHSNTFYLMPIWEGALDRPDTTDDEYRQQIAKMKKEFGPGNNYNKLGFASIYNAGNLPLLLRQLKVFRENNIHRGVIFAMQTHDAGLTNPNGDLRNYQWRLNGKTWRGMPGPVQGRDTLVVTPSRYATAIREEMRRKAKRWAGDIKTAMRAYPGVISVINFSIEEELAIGGATSNAYIGDYSPFAIAEFRDWLRHRGLYAPGARFAKQGAPEEITGPFTLIDGHRVSPFYDDPTPDNSNGTGHSFNETFGTDFKTWNLAYWDLEKYPDPITDPHFNPSPESGNGFTAGGFDAPRVQNHFRWWRAWNWTYQGNNNMFPPGNPSHPAYGFRECEVAHFVRDVASLLIAEGLPEELLYAHQIPAELLGDATAGVRRALSSASTIWSGFLPQNGHLGITRFGSLNPAMITQYSHNWGIFEWHPAPNQPPDSPVLYHAALSDLRKFVAHGCHALFPGWWHSDRVGKTFPLNDSNLAKAIHTFLAEQPDAPHWSKG
ncbi:MAG: hypothetical protein M0Z50_02010 [Planctomycetia bacterium]|nr:hypothetical protein [Planctomycetia bacterium]